MAKKTTGFSKEELSFIWMNSDITIEFQMIRDFLDNTSELIAKESKKLKAEMKDQQKKYKHDRESLYMIDDYYSDGLARYGGVYKSLFFNTTFVAAVSMFEYLLKKMCSLYYKEYSLTVDDIRANGHIATYRKYIEKVIKVDLSSLNDKWKAIEKYNSIRNAIVHDYADVNPKGLKNITGQDVYVFLSKSPHIKFDRKGSGKFKIIDSAFIIEFIDLAERYLEGVMAKLGERTMSSLMKKI